MTMDSADDPLPAITFETGGAPYPDGLAWRPLDGYERSILEHLLAAVLTTEQPTVPALVRRTDECGCIEFNADDSPEHSVIRAEGSVPSGHPAYPLEIMLATRAGAILWLEFNHYGHDRSRRPPASDFEVWKC